MRESAAALIPGLFDGAQASASVTTRFAGRARRFPARVTRVAGSIAPLTRTLDVTVALLDSTLPTEAGAGGDAPASGLPPALVNAWADVVIDGQVPGTVYAIDAAHVRAGDTLWLMADERLAIVPIRVLQVEAGTSYVALDVAPADGARLVTSLLAAPVDGMPIRVAAPSGDGVPADDAALTLGAAQPPIR